MKCRYEDCIEQNPIAAEYEQVTCPTCREFMGLPPLDPGEGITMDSLETAHSQAIAYVWGRQDAGESAHDTGYSLDFGKAYRERRKLYETDGNGVGMMPCLQDAFKEWRETGSIS